MIHSRTPVSAETQGDAAASRTRRQFLKLASASAATLTLQACGGGGDAGAGALAQGGPAPASTAAGTTLSGGSLPSALVPPSSPPVWSLIPPLSFTQGVKSSISISKYVKSSSGGPLAIALNSVTLPPGVTYNARTLSFVYDGIGAAGTATGLVLTASDI